ncbi:hypothetical protein PI95_032670 [Hassallia byssoidea VB512170]|uniref:Uncharacterized protein n=1 Tax=Hassallia byssoidea VB512170 TaxID=1304833 RepID=A0A846HHY1_9CYAN|nr:hypothetical protein [Hassalia byssoidea]NEU77127.1 hypothetical protein [Hassalia byssoidea VB512170]
MSFARNSQPLLAVDSNSNHTSHSEEGNIYGLTVPEIAISVGGSFGFIVAWVVFFLMLSKLRTVVDNKIVFSINSLNKLPCQNCEFFCSNNYLKCAVQPSMVMTEAAKNCSDYSPKNSKSSRKNF